MLKQIKAIFTPQVWINRDYGMNVDPPGPDEWFVSVTEKELERLEWDAYARDDLRFDDSAPQWVKDWQGPFEVDIEEIENDPARG